MLPALTNWPSARFGTQALGLGITAVLGGAAALLVGEELQTNIDHVSEPSFLQIFRMGRKSIFLQDLDVVGVLVAELGEVDHQARQEGLTGALGAGGEPAGEPERWMRPSPAHRRARPPRDPAHR